MTDDTIYIDINTRRIVSDSGQTPPSRVWAVGDTIRCGVVPVVSEGERTRKVLNLPIRTITAAVGRVNARPTKGRFKLLGDDVASEEIEIAATAEEIQAAMPSGAKPEQVILISPGVWMIRMPADKPLAGPAEDTVEGNTLAPSSFVRVSQRTWRGGEWYEVKLVQTPMAFTASFNRVLATAPSITTVRNGFPREVGVSANTNEVQALRLPVGFIGTYYLTFDYRATTTLGIQDGVDKIAAALNALYDDGVERFKVTNPETEIAHIEFVGPLAEANQAEIVVNIATFEIGVPTIELPLTFSSAYESFQNGEKSVKVQLEVELEIVDDPADLEDEEVTGRVISFQQEITVTDELIYAGLAAIPATQWLRPPQPVNYQRYAPGQIITGQQHYVSVRGDGVADTFVVDHGLATDSISGLVVRPNGAGQVFTQGADYLWEINDEDEIVVVTTDVPTLNGIVIIVTAAGPTSVFEQHGHEIDEIVGLRTELNALGARLSAVEVSTGGGVSRARDTTAGAARMEILLPVFSAFFPSRTTLPLVKSIAELPVSSLPKDGGLLRAIHDAESEALPTTLPLPSASNKGKVYQNRGLTNVALSGGGGRPSRIIKPGEFAASDGRYLFGVNPTGVPVGLITFTVPTHANDTLVFDPTITIPNDTQVMCRSSTTLPAGLGAALTARYVINSAAGSCKLSASLGGSAIDITDAGTGTHTLFVTRGTTTSWYPSDFDRVLFTVPVNSDAFLLDGRVELKLGFEVGILSTKTRAPYISDRQTRAQWKLVLETGTFVSETSPATTGRNIRKIVWNPVPVLEKVIYITNDTPAIHTFGMRVDRIGATDVSGSFVVKKSLYNTWSGSTATLSTADFMIRGTLSEFDTEDVDDGRGFLALVGLNVSIGSSEDKGDATVGKLTVS